VKVRERERERETERENKRERVCVCVCVRERESVCERERERERERKRERERECEGESVGETEIEKGTQSKRHGDFAKRISKLSVHIVPSARTLKLNIHSEYELATVGRLPKYSVLAHECKRALQNQK